MVVTCIAAVPEIRYSHVSSDVRGFGGAAESVYQCNSCFGTCRFPTYLDKNGLTFGKNASPALVQSRSNDPFACQPRVLEPFGNDVGLSLMLGHILNNPVLSATRYSHALEAARLQPYGRDMYNQMMRNIEESTSRCLETQMETGINFLTALRDSQTGSDGLKLIYSVDGCYLNRGHHSKYMTATLFNTNYHVLVGTAHVMQKMKTAQHWFSFKFGGTATGAEAFGIEILCQQMALAELKPSLLVLDLDSTVWKQVRKILPDITISPCFNHFCKACKKRLTDAFAGKAPCGDHKCHCTGNHRRTSDQNCGCGSAEHAHHLYSMLFGAASQAKSDAVKFGEIVGQFKEHLRGNHTNCTFHAQFQCDPTKCTQASKPCDSRGCDCGECPKDGPRECFGNSVVKEPVCQSRVPWKSSLPVLTCPRDLALLDKEIDAIVQAAHELIIEAIGKVDTCYNEHVNKVIGDARAKGQRPKASIYAAMTNVGLLRANQIYYVQMMREKTYGNRDDARIEDDWLWEYHVHRDCAVPLSQDQLVALKADVQQRIRLAAELKSDKAKVRRVKQKQKRNADAKTRRTHDIGATYASRMELENPLRPKLHVAGSGVLVVFDIETAGWGRYSEEIVELSAQIVTYTHTEGGQSTDCTFVSGAQFSKIARCMYRNLYLADKLHQDVERWKNAADAFDTEVALTQSFVEYLRANLTSVACDTCPAYFVAHNGRICDGQWLELALHRAGFDSKELFAELHLHGLIDTAFVSEFLPWDGFSTPVQPAPLSVDTTVTGPVIASLTQSQTDAVASASTEFESDSGDSSDGYSESASVSSGDSGDETVDESDDEAGVCGETPTPTQHILMTPPPRTQTQRTEATPTAVSRPPIAAPYAEAFRRVMDSRKVSIAKMTAAKTATRGAKTQGDGFNTQSKIYARLFGCDPTDIHSAIGDVIALTAIVTHPHFWSRIYKSNQSAIHWNCISLRAHELLHQHLGTPDSGGWVMQDCPRCRHGPMKPASNPHSSAPEDAMQFNCLLKKCDTMYKPTHPSFVPNVSASKRGKKRVAVPADGESDSPAATKRAVKDNGSSGACQCTSKCATNGCPCRAAGLACGQACTHGRKPNSRASKPVACQNHLGQPASKSQPDKTARSSSSKNRASLKRRRVRVVDSEAESDGGELNDGDSESDTSSDQRNASANECTFVPE